MTINTSTSNSQYLHLISVCTPAGERLVKSVKPIIISLFILVLLAAIPAQILAEKPKAADLVEDGQPIDLSSERYHILFKELQDEYQFKQNELNDLFNGVSIKK